MGIRESLLNTITSVGNSDFVRIVTSAGVSSKATVQNLFKSFETGLGAKSSLTTGDYIRVVGSDNALYKQGMSSVKGTLDSMSVMQEYSASTFADLDTLLSNKTAHYYATVSSATGAPANANSWNIYGFENSSHNYCFQMAMSFNDALYKRYKLGSTTWSDWQKLPTRAEVDALNSKTYTELTVYDGRVANARVADTDKSRVVINGNVAVVYFDVTYVKSVTSNQTSIFTLPTNIKPKYNTYSSCIDITSGKSFILQVSSSGNVNVLNNGQININDQVTGQATFIIN